MIRHPVRVGKRVCLLFVTAILPCACSGAKLDAASSTDASADPGIAGEERDAATAAVEGAMDARPKSDRPAADCGLADAKPNEDVFYAPVKCADNLIFCEDFEGGALDPARWKTWANGAKVTFDTDRVGSGKRALHIKETSVGEPPATCRPGKEECVSRGAFIQTIKRFPIAGNTLHVRFFLWMDKLTPNRWFPIAWVTADGSHCCSDKGFGVNLIPASDTQPARSSFQLWAGSDNEVGGGAAPTEAWACWELEFRDGNLLTLHLDEKPILTRKLSTANTAFDGPLSIGLEHGHPDIFTHPDGFNLWVDDVAISTDHIGCAR